MEVVLLEQQAQDAEAGLVDLQVDKPSHGRFQLDALPLQLLRQRVRFADSAMRR